MQEEPAAGDMPLTDAFVASLEARCSSAMRLLAPEVHAALGDGLDKWKQDTVAFFDKVNAEDKFVVEGIHRGSASPLARPGPFSWLEREIHDFARYLDRRLNGEHRDAMRVAAE